MKTFESAPQTYDLGLSLISLGHINKIRHHIVDNFIVPGDKVLDIGCGTGPRGSGFLISSAQVQFELIGNNNPRRPLFW